MTSNEKASEGGESEKPFVVLDTLLKKPVALPTAPGKHPGKGSLAVKKKEKKGKREMKVKKLTPAPSVILPGREDGLRLNWRIDY